MLVFTGMSVHTCMWGSVSILCFVEKKVNMITGWCKDLISTIILSAHLPSLLWALTIYSRSFPSLLANYFMSPCTTTTSSYSYMFHLHHSTTHKKCLPYSRIHETSCWCKNPPIGPPRSHTLGPRRSASLCSTEPKSAHVVFTGVPISFTI